MQTLRSTIASQSIAISVLGTLADEI